MIKSRAFLALVGLSWPLMANMPGPPPAADPFQECAEKKVGEHCRFSSGGWGYDAGSCQVIDNKLQCQKNSPKEQSDITFKSEVMNAQDLAHEQAVGCVSMGDISGTISLSSILLGLFLIMRKRKR